MGKYYIDTCIWINIFKKEYDFNKRKSIGKLSKKFIMKIISSESDELFCSGIVLRELQLKLSPQEYAYAIDSIEEIDRFNRVEVIEEDKKNARKLESRYNFEISFYDLIHLVISKRLSLVLITRDTGLIKAAKQNGVDARTPEEAS